MKCANFVGSFCCFKISRQIVLQLYKLEIIEIWNLNDTQYVWIYDGKKSDAEDHTLQVIDILDLKWNHILGESLNKML